MPWQAQLRKHGVYSARGSEPRPSRFELLASVTIRNLYFPGGAVTDAGMRIEPAPFSATLMSGLGLLLIHNPDGFAIAYDKAGPGFGRLARSWLRSVHQEDPLRLGFSVRFEDPLFVNYSGLPFELDPRLEALYLDNIEQLERNDPYVVPDSGTDVLSVEPRTFRVDFITGSEFVVVRNLFGQQVQSYPRITEHGKAARTFVYVDLSPLPDGKYEVAFLDSHGEQVGVHGWRLYLSAIRNPLMFLELVLAPDDYRPRGPISTDVAWVPSPAELRVPPQLHYEVVFDARAVHFRYVVVAPTLDNPYDHLKIRAERPSGLKFKRSNGFFQGRPAVMFTATTPVRLRQAPDSRLTLLGRDSRRGGGEHVLVERLPLPGPAHLTRECERLTSQACIYI